MLLLGILPISQDLWHAGYAERSLAELLNSMLYCSILIGKRTGVYYYDCKAGDGRKVNSLSRRVR